MFVPSTTGDLLAPTSMADSGTGVINSTAITATNNGSMNALTMFLFWFFLCSTGVLVIGSVVVLRRLKQREQGRKTKKAKKAASTPSTTTADKEMDEESSIGGSTVSLAPVVRTYTGTTQVKSA